MTKAIRFLAGGPSTRVVPLPTGRPVRVGRSPGEDLRVRAEGVAARHLLLELDPGGPVRVEPVEGAPPVHVDGVEVEDGGRVVDVDAVLALGEARLRVVEVGEDRWTEGSREPPCALCGGAIPAETRVKELGPPGSDPACPRCVDRRLLAPRSLDRYRIIRRIGRSSFEIVYLAAERPRGERVVLRLLRADRMDRPGVERRFVARGLCGISMAHPTFLRHLDVGRHEGIPFLVTERVPWVKIGDLLRAGRPLDLAEALLVLAQVVDAARYARRRAVHLGWPVVDRLVVDEAYGIRVTTFWPTDDLVRMLAGTIAPRHPDLAETLRRDPPAPDEVSPRITRYLHGTDAASADRDAATPRGMGHVLYLLTTGRILRDLPDEGLDPARLLAASLVPGQRMARDLPEQVTRSMGRIYASLAGTDEAYEGLGELQADLRSACLALPDRPGEDPSHASRPAASRTSRAQ